MDHTRFVKEYIHEKLGELYNRECVRLRVSHEPESVLMVPLAEFKSLVIAHYDGGHYPNENKRPFPPDAFFRKKLDEALLEWANLASLEKGLLIIRVTVPPIESIHRTR